MLLLLMQKLRKNDPVQVIAGKYKGTISVITRRSWDLVVVEGVNVQKRAKKGEWYINVTKPIHVSNVMYYSDSHKAASKISIETDTRGKKQRKLVKFGDLIK